MSNTKLDEETIDVYKPSVKEYRFIKKHQGLATSLRKELHLHTIDIQALMLLYHAVVTKGASDYMSTLQFGLILNQTFDITDQFMIDCIVKLILKRSQQKTYHITMEMWVRMMDLYLKGTLDEKMEYCFGVYDVANKSFITRVDMLRFMKNSIINNNGLPDEESVLDLIDIIMKLLDNDRDGKISFKDYSEMVTHQPELMEFLGNCLPSRKVVVTFLTTLSKVKSRSSR